MNKFVEILIGLVFLIVPIYLWIIGYAGFGTSALVVLKGGLIWAALGIGAIFIMIGIMDIKD